MPPDPDSIDLGRLLRQSFADWNSAGVKQLPRKSPLAISQSAAVAPPTTAPPAATPTPEQPARTKPPAAALPGMTPEPTMSMSAEPLPPPVADPAAELSLLQEEVSGCTLCKELAATRTQTVFGVGNPSARLVFFGEAPGADEDARGEPFVGRAGQLLTKIIEACTLKRSDVYILNTLKCRPPGNRNRTTDEAANCRPYFERQLEIIQPEYICCLGSVAAQNLLETTESIGRLRGKFHAYRGMKVIATYHPAYLLRNPSAKRQVWDDMQMLMRAMGIKLPGK